MAKKRTATKKTSIHKKTVHVARKAHRTVKHHYFKHMPDKKHHRILIWVVFFAVAGIIALQLLYPPDRALPLTKLQGDMVGWQKEDELAFRIQELFSQSSLRLIAGTDTTVEATIAEVGGEPNAAATTERLVSYPFWQRFIPLSILFHADDIATVEIRYTDPIVRQFAERASGELSVPPQNARLSIEDGAITAVDDAPGSAVKAEDVFETIKLSSSYIGTTTDLEVPHETVTATTTATDVSKVREQAEATLAREVTIRAGDKEFTPNRTERASWIQLRDNDGTISLVFDEKKAGDYISSVNKEVYVAPGTTTVFIRDGKETRRDTGSNGREINQSQLAEQLEAWVMRGEGSDEVTASFRAVAPRVEYSTSYSSSQAGLQAYVSAASNAQNANIVVRQTNGAGWQASASGSMSIPSASTYKLYVSWVLFNKMNEGKISWNDPMQGTTVSGCFDRMTIASTNPCAEQWLSEFGRSNVNNYLYSQGYSRGTSFTNPVATHTTANDLAKFMTSLEYSQNISGANKSRLMKSLSTHPYRQGVPSGSRGQVWDKVGFLWDYVHDAAIVHHPKGNYVIVVMTKGRSYGTIAEITRQVEAIMYP